MALSHLQGFYSEETSPTQAPSLPVEKFGYESCPNQHCWEATQKRSFSSRWDTILYVKNPNSAGRRANETAGLLELINLYQKSVARNENGCFQGRCGQQPLQLPVMMITSPLGPIPPFSWFSFLPQPPLWGSLQLAQSPNALAFLWPGPRQQDFQLPCWVTLT